MTADWQPREFEPGPTVFAEWAIDGVLTATPDARRARRRRRQVPDRQEALRGIGSVGWPASLHHDSHNPTGYSRKNIRRQVVISAALLAAAQMSGSALAQASYRASPSPSS